MLMGWEQHCGLALKLTRSRSSSLVWLWCTHGVAQAMFFWMRNQRMERNKQLIKASHVPVTINAVIMQSPNLDIHTLLLFCDSHWLSCCYFNHPRWAVRSFVASNSSFLSSENKWPSADIRAAWQFRLVQSWWTFSTVRVSLWNIFHLLQFTNLYKDVYGQEFDPQQC